MDYVYVIGQCVIHANLSSIIWLFYYLTLCILKDYPIHIDAISMGEPIEHFKGSQVEFYQLECISGHEYCFKLSKKSKYFLPKFLF